MSIWSAILLGIVQGLTDFLPVSSSGHMSIIYNLFNISSAADGNKLFDALLHIGTISSVLIVYRGEIAEMFYELLSFADVGPLAGQPKNRHFAAREFIMIFAATLPLLLVLPVRARLEMLYYRNIFVGVAVFLTGCVLYTADRMPAGKKNERNMTILDAIIIGISQCTAAIPGLSRSGIAITGGIAVGLRKDYAVKFAFLLSVPASLGVCIFKIADAAGAGVDWSLLPAYLLGMVFSLLSGILAINILKNIGEKGKFGGFVYYCWVVGVLGIILSMIF